VAGLGAIASQCCSLEQQGSCCEPSENRSCCDPVSSSCGCAGAQADDEQASPAVIRVSKPS